MSVAIVWFRNDLRLDDNPALRMAVEAGHTPLPVYVHAPEEEGAWAPGAASESWRHHSLQALHDDLKARGSALQILRGPSERALQRAIEHSGAEAIFWNRKYEPATQPRDAALKKQWKEHGLHAESANGALLFEPWDLATQQGGPYKVFTPFWRAALARWLPPAPWNAPQRLPQPPRLADAVPLDALALQPRPRWDTGFWEAWRPGEAGAREALEIFIDGALRGYRQDRDRPDRVGTSRLSPYLHFGEIAVWRVVDALQAERSAANATDIDGFIRELGWREFAVHLLHHFPHTPAQNLNLRFEHFEWAEATPAFLDAWQQGRTGVPIVDAGMRELWATGYMHNRVRMIVASYLTKHMRLHWLHGARWFWDTLVDADLANNTLGWQWTAGTGADAAPYFRVFNPVSQSERFDPSAEYIARWVPELRALPARARFAPWQHAGAAALAPGYPARPLVDLADGRNAALAAYRATGVV